MLSEEEIIKNTKTILEHYQKIKDIKDPIERDIESSCYIEEMPFNELQGLLDLYNKEKEKNKELEQLSENIKMFREKNLSSEIDYVIALKSNFMEYLKEDYISKDKIRNKFDIAINEFIDKEGYIVKILKFLRQELLEESE